MCTTPERDGTLPHYQLGDLGLIPRPTQHIASNFERMQELSATTRLGTLKKVLTKSVAVQTNSAPKVRRIHACKSKCGGSIANAFIYNLNE